MVKIFVILIYIFIYIYSSSWAVQYALRVTRAGECSVEHKKMEIIDISIKPYNLQHYVNVSVRVNEDFRMQKMSVRFNRCSMDDYKCEYFQSWNFNNICPIMFMKNQMWSPTVEKLRPKMGCPNVKKGIYKVENGTLDVNKAVRFYPDVAKYNWNFNFTIFDNHKEKVYCINYAGHLVPLKQSPKFT